MSELKKFSNITNKQIQSYGVQALADRPNVSSQYGASGLTPAKLKLWFDKLATFLAGRVNDIGDVLSSDEAGSYIRIPLDDAGVGTLSALVESFANGTFAHKILNVYPSVSAYHMVSLQEALYGIAQFMGETDEELGRMKSVGGASFYIGIDTSTHVLNFSLLNEKGDVLKSDSADFSYLVNAARSAAAVEANRASGEADRARDEADRASSEAINALADAKESGVFDGVSVTHVWDGSKLIVTSASGTSESDLRGPEGKRGETGKGFEISKTYASVLQMHADYGNPAVPLYGFVLIDTGNVEDEDNAKLFVKQDDGYQFLIDLSGSEGIKGERGYSAYDTAVQLGFIGSEDEWIASLKKPAEDAAKNVVDIANDAAENALKQAKESGEFDGKSAYAYAKDGGYKGTESEFAEDINPDKIKANAQNFIATELAKRGQLKPEFANNVSECTDTTKLYVLPDGFIYAHRALKNYNLLKLSEVSYSSRLQNDVAGIIASNANNIVTGWIPVQYGKYYTPSVLYNGSRITGDTAFALIVRVNVKLDDGTIVVYGNTIEDRTKILYHPSVNETITLEHENAVAVMLHMLIGNNDISTRGKLEAYQPMVIEGDSIEDATNKSLTYDYLNGNTEFVADWYNTGHAFVPADYEPRIIDLETDMGDVKIKMQNLEDNMQNPKSASPYYRDVNFGVLPFSYYRGVADSYENSAFGWTTKYADYIAMWKSVVANHSGYVTETALGSASDGQTVYLYDFKPVRISNQDKPIPKIIIVAGQHGGETANIFGLYYFVNNLLNKWNKHPSLEYLRNHVELMVIPVLNTYGFDNLSYKNANGVNLNRNYDSNWEFVEDTTSTQYGGAKPFDQPETQIVRDLLLRNTDAVLVVDSHVNGGGKVANYSDINYYGISESTDEYFNRMVDAVAHNLSAISANFNLDYELGQSDTIMGFLNHADGVGILRNWARDKNLVSVLVEGFGGFPNRTAFTAEVFKANEEIFVNWLITAMNYLAK